MNAPKSYHRNHSGRNRQFTLYTLSNKDLELPCKRTKGERDYTNPAYRFYWAEHVRAMTGMTATASKVLAQIIEDQREKGYCTRSVKNLGMACACSPRTVARGLAAMSKEGLITIHEWYRPRGRGRTSSHIYVNWEHERWNGCPERGVSGSSTEGSQLTDSMTAILAEDSLRENFRELATAVSITVQEPEPTVSTAEEKTQAEKVEEPEAAPETTQRAVLGTLIELGVPARIAISDAKRAPFEALAVLAMVYRILNRGGIRNPAGLARAALRDPGRYLRSPLPAALGGVARAGPGGARPCWKCGLPLDPREGCVDGMHFACDEASRG